jgi:hypothetical protein
MLNWLSLRPAWHKNGIWWHTKMLCALVGEARYDRLRVLRRAAGMEFYYRRQQALYRLFVTWPEMANLIGIYPKTDNSHGFPAVNGYEMYRDFQENTFNGDGSYSMYIYLFGGLYSLHIYYSYMHPYLSYDDNNEYGDEHQARLRDQISSTIFEELCGNNYLEWAFSPHDFHYNRQKLIQGYMHPDDPRSMHMNTFLRPNRYREHYITRSREGRTFFDP